MVNFIYISVCMVSLFFQPLREPQLEWIIEPIIENVDDIELQREVNHLITITKDNKDGVVNLKNEVIVPPKYKWIQITNEEKLINAAKLESGNDFFKSDGEIISYEKYQKLTTKNQEPKPYDRKLEEANSFFKKVLKKKGEINFKQRDNTISRINGYYNVYSPNNKLLAEDTKISVSKFIGDLFLTIYDQPTKENKIVNIKSGEIIHTGPKYDLFENESGYFSLKERDKSIVFNPKGENLGEFVIFKLNKSKPLGIGKNHGKMVLYNLESMTQIGTDNSSISQISDDSAYYIFSGPDSTSVYNHIDGSFIHLPYKYHLNKLNVEEHQFVMSKDSLQGVYNIKNDKWIIEPIYNQIVVTKSKHYLALKEKQQKKFTSMTLLNAYGKVLYDKSNLGIYCLPSAYRIIENDTSTTLKAYSGEIIKQYGSNINLSSNVDGTVITLRDKATKKPATTILIADLIAGKSNTFDYVVETIKSTSNPELKWYIIKSEGLLGIVDQSGKTILPVQYDVIKADKKKRYYKVKKNNLWGMFKHP